MSIEEIERAAMALPAAEREQLAERLWLSVDGATREEIDAAWVEEVARRAERCERGETKAIPHDQAMREFERPGKA